MENTMMMKAYALALMENTMMMKSFVLLTRHNMAVFKMGVLLQWYHVHMRYIELHSRVAFKVVFYKLLY
jgi:hypothetical protein